MVSPKSQAAASHVARAVLAVAQCEPRIRDDVIQLE